MGDEAYDLQRTILLKPEYLHLRTTHVSIPVDSNFLEKVQTTMRKDCLVLDIQQHLKNRIEDSSKFKIENHLLYFEERLYILDGLLRIQVLQAHHDLPTVGHFGFNKTLELISRDFW